MKLSHDVLLALAYVSQLSDPQLVRSRFFESLNGLDEGFIFEFVDRLPPDVPGCRVLPVTTLRSSFGYAVMAETPAAGESELAVFRNAFQFLAVVLENRMQTQVLESKNISLVREINQEKSLLRTVLDTLPVGVWITDKDGTIIMANAACERIWAGVHYIGIDRYAEYKAWESETGDLLKPDDWAAARVIKTGDTLIDQEIKIKCFDGTYKTVLNSAAPLFDEEMGIVGAVAVNQDITERKRAEKELQQSESHLRTLVQTIPDLVWLKDQDGVFLSCNRGFGRLFNATESEIKGKTDFDFVDRELAEFFQENDKKVIAAGKPISNEEWVTFADDDHHCLLETIKTPMYDDQGTLIGVLGVGRDITNRKQAEQELRDSEARFKVLHNASFGGIAIHDKGIILECNQGLSEITGYSVTELMGMDGLLLIAESRQLVMENILSGYEKPYEAIGLRKDGTEFPLRLEGRNIPYKGKPVRTVEFRDISESKRSEEERKKLQGQLIQAQKMESIGQLAGGVAHDYNNALSVIMGFTELVMNRLDPLGDLYADLEEVLSAAKRSTDITRQLLSFARKQTVAPKVLDINASVESMLKMLRRLIGEDLDLVWGPGTEVWPVKIDPSQVDQLMANLCVNARDAIEGVGKVTIETKNFVFNQDYCDDHLGFIPGEYVMIAVSDDGAGIAPEILDKIFEPFFTTKEMGKGTGLGLATVYGIAKQNDGFINVYSEPEKGTTIKIYLPRHIGQTVHVSSDSSLELPLSKGEIILLVEDDNSILLLGERLLKELGYTVLSSTSTLEAIKLAEEHAGEIHLLITDVVMPAMNGRELSERLKRQYPHIKTLFMSGYTANVIAHRGVLDEGVYFMPKPFSKQDMAFKVREALDTLKSSLVQDDV